MKNIPRNCLNHLSDFRKDVDVTHVVVDASGNIKSHVKILEEASIGLDITECHVDEKQFNISYSFSKHKGFLQLLNSLRFTSSRPRPCW